MTITKLFIVDEFGTIIRFVSVEDCATKFCGACIMKRLSNHMFDTREEFDRTVENCLVAENADIRKKCEIAHFGFFS